VPYDYKIRTGTLIIDAVGIASTSPRLWERVCNKNKLLKSTNFCANHFFCRINLENVVQLMVALLYSFYKNRHFHVKYFPLRRQLGMKVVRIISASDPIRIQIMRIWRRVFDIHADVDNPNPIVCGCGLGYGVSDIRHIWIIR
jgi:hypothetical protein